MSIDLIKAYVWVNSCSIARSSVIPLDTFWGEIICRAFLNSFMSFCFCSYRYILCFSRSSTMSSWCLSILSSLAISRCLLRSSIIYKTAGSLAAMPSFILTIFWVDLWLLWRFCRYYSASLALLISSWLTIYDYLTSSVTWLSYPIESCVCSFVVTF